MTAIETLEAAIGRLEELRDRAPFLPWSLGEHDTRRSETCLWANGSTPFISTVAIGDEDSGVAGGELVAALSRTVDPLIAMHRRSVLSMKAAIGMGMPEADVSEIAERSGEVDVARAILGERSIPDGNE